MNIIEAKVNEGRISEAEEGFDDAQKELEFYLNMGLQSAAAILEVVMPHYMAQSQKEILDAVKKMFSHKNVSALRRSSSYDGASPPGSPRTMSAKLAFQLRTLKTTMEDPKGAGQVKLKVGLQYRVLRPC